MAESELELVQRAAGGDEDAFRLLVEAHGRRIYGLAYRITGDGASAEDVVQETFMKAHRALHRFDGRAQFATWIYRIAANTAIEHTRKVRVRREVVVAGEGAALDPLPTGEPGPERLAVSADLRRALASAMAALTPVERTAFVLRHYEGRSTLEIAETLGLRANNSRQAVFRAVRKLRQALAPLHFEGRQPITSEVQP